MAEKERQAGLQKEAEAQRLSRRCRSLDGRRRSLQLAVERSALYGRFLEQVLKTATVIQKHNQDYRQSLDKKTLCLFNVELKMVQPLFLFLLSIQYLTLKNST